MFAAKTALIATLATLVSAVAALGQEEVLRHVYDKAGGTRIEIESLFGTAARHGALPFRITIRNNTGKDRAWTVTFREGHPGRKLTTESTYRFEVENASEVRHEVVFHFAPAFAAYDYRNLAVEVSAPGLRDVSRNAGQQTNQSFPMLAISKPLARRSLAALDDHLEKQNSNNHFFAKPFEPDALPSDWLGYTGLDFFLVDLDSWNNLQSSQRQAVISWVRLGGNLEVYTETGETIGDLGLPGGNRQEASATQATLSLGRVRVQEWNGSELPTALVGHYSSHRTRDQELEGYYGTDWPLQESLESKDFNAAVIFALLVGFAVLVGPVNLFYFAKSGRRHRLFVTTPVISVAACLVVVVFILLKDGVGGQGLRVVFADLQPTPGEMRLYTSQEQVSRTGVMVDPGFEADRRLGLAPVNLPESAYNPLSPRNRRTTTYEIEGPVFRGGLFRSRSEQGFVVCAAEPTRARIEITAPSSEGSPPRLVSSLASPIGEFYYLDTDARLWKSPPGTTVAPGSAIPLEPADRNAFEAWLRRETSGFSRPLAERIARLGSEADRFFALPDDDSAFPLPTHPSLDWENRAVLLSGSPLPRNPATLSSDE
ncbi:MAG: hypothetical protein WD342_19070 [Verrucomicrobiales bacterium]